MAIYLIEWTDTRTVYTEVNASSVEDAKKQCVAGKGIEIDWTGSGSPESVMNIVSVKKGDT